MITDFEKLNVSQWASVRELIGILAELTMTVATYRNVEIPVPEHFAQKEDEIRGAIKILYRADMAKQALFLEQELKSMRTDDEVKSDLKQQIANLKSRLGVEQPKKIDAPEEG